MMDDEAYYSILHFIQIFIGLRNTNDQTVQSNRVNGHAGRLGDEAIFRRHGNRHTYTMTTAQHDRNGGLGQACITPSISGLSSKATSWGIRCSYLVVLFWGGSTRCPSI